MNKLEIVPRKGVGPIAFGMQRQLVREVMRVAGFPLENSHNALDYFCENAIQVEYDEDTASFIGISCCPEKFECMYMGINVFDVSAAELFQHICAQEDKKYEFDSDDFCFPKQGITLWNSDEQYDRYRQESRPVYAQVGLGDERYLVAVGAYNSSLHTDPQAGH